MPILRIVKKEDDICEVEEVGGKKEDERSNGREINNGDVFDTNHKYGGVYFAPARRLYDAIRTGDVGSNRHRAIELVEKMQS